MRLLHATCAAMIWAACTTAAPAQTGDLAVQRANRMAYEASMKCFVANGVATGEREDAGDREAAARYERTARKSFNTAVKLGEALGYTGTRINQDFGLAQARELPKLATDGAYNRTTATTCRALGLM